MGASVVERGITVAEYMKSQNELVAEVFAGERVAGKLTADQQAVLKVLQNSDTPLTANEIRFANRQTQKIDVEKTVSELSKAGLIQGEFRQFGDKGRPAKRYRISDTCTVSVSRNAKNPDENWTSTYTDTIAEDKSAVSGTEVIEGFEEYRNLEASSKSVEQPNGSSVGMTEDVSGVDGNTANTEADDYSGGWAVRDGYETTTLDGEYSPDFDDSQWESDRRDASHRR
jgi:predicted transcriptional regulator